MTKLKWSYDSIAQYDKRTPGKYKSEFEGKKNNMFNIKTF